MCGTKQEGRNATLLCECPNVTSEPPSDPPSCPGIEHATKMPISLVAPKGQRRAQKVRTEVTKLSRECVCLYMYVLRASSAWRGFPFVLEV